MAVHNVHDAEIDESMRAIERAMANVRGTIDNAMSSAHAIRSTKEWAPGCSVALATLTDRMFDLAEEARACERTLAGMHADIRSGELDPTRG